MTVEELRRALQDLPGHLKVHVVASYDTEVVYAPLRLAYFAQEADDGEYWELGPLSHPSQGYVQLDAWGTEDD